MAEEQSTLSVRNLIETDIGPLRRFSGILESAPEETKYYGEGELKRPSTSISFNFKEIEVIEAVEPYHFPIFTVMLTRSNRKKSKYGVFGVSLATLLDKQYTPEQLDPSAPDYLKPQDRMDLADCFGKRLGLVVADGEDGRPAQHSLFDGRAKDEAHPKGQDVPTSVWEVYMVEGIGSTGDDGTTPVSEAMRLLDGKTLSEFNKAALNSDIIRSDTALMQSIGMPVSAPASFANTMTSTKQFTKDKTGIYHKVEEA